MVTSGISLTVLLVFALGGVLFGALIMYLILDAVHNQKEAREVAHTQPLLKIDPELAEELEPVVSEETLGVVEAEDENEFDFTIGRNKEDGRLLILMDGLWHENLSSLSAVQKERLQLALRESAAWLDMQMVKESPEIKQAVSGENNTSKSDGVKTKVAMVAGDAPFRKLTIVEQVDDILQDILEGEGLKERNIRLSEMVNRGVIVWIGQQFYEGIDAVPDAEVKQLVRRAVRKWEETASSL